jgi:hypothetical protein
LAVELMALGRPVICNIREDGMRFLPPDMARELPLIRAEPATLAAVLREWLTTRRDELPRLGKQSRRYVERWHDPQDGARGLLADYGTPANPLRKRGGGLGPAGNWGTLTEGASPPPR